MTQYFLDSSALIKRYIVEPGTTWVRSIIQRSSGNTVIIAQITRIEIVSGASRRVREGTLTSRTARAVRLLTRASRAYGQSIGSQPGTRRRGWVGGVGVWRGTSDAVGSSRWLATTREAWVTTAR